jgi:hypothetical protein
LAVHHLIQQVRAACAGAAPQDDLSGSWTVSWWPTLLDAWTRATSAFDAVAAEAAVSVHETVRPLDPPDVPRVVFRAFEDPRDLDGLPPDVVDDVGPVFVRLGQEALTWLRREAWTRDVVQRFEEAAWSSFATVAAAAQRRADLLAEAADDVAAQEHDDAEALAARTTLATSRLMADLHRLATEAREAARATAS